MNWRNLTPDQEIDVKGRILCAVRDNPPDLRESHGIGVLHYLHRVCVYAELVSDDGHAVKAMP